MRLVKVEFKAPYCLERVRFLPGSIVELEAKTAIALQAEGILSIAELTNILAAAVDGLRIAGMMRIRNEERWIAEVLRSMKEICTAGIVIFDDTSDDQTRVEVLRVANEFRHSGGPEIVWLPSPFARALGIDEARDKEYLLARTMEAINPDWILCIDGDEVLAPDAAPSILGCIKHGDMWAYSIRVCYAWDNPDTIRIDGIYGNFWRPSLFYTRVTDGQFRRSGAGGNFHCSNVPADLLRVQGICKARIKHYGYLDRAKRLEKYAWYNRIDPGNESEDCYRHMVQGDIEEIPYNAELKHAGPLRLAPWV